MSKGRSPADRPTPQLPTAFNDLDIGIAVHEPRTGRIVDANDALERLYGYTTPELQTRAIATFSANTYGDGQQAITRRLRATAEGCPQTFEWRIKRSDGQFRWVEITFTHYPHNGIPYVLAEVTDITDYKHNDRRVSLLQRVLRHNLRNEISVVEGFADQLTDPAPTPTIDTCAEKITTSARKLARVAESMKQIEATITSEAATRSRRSVKTAVGDIADDVRAAYPAATINVIETTPLWIDIDEAFGYAIRHALENGVEHAECAAPTVRVEIDESPNTGRVEIRIDDENPPIPPMELCALDDHQATTPTCHGSGCGLFVMKWCLESLGGELRIEPASDRGNSVYVYLPPQSPPEGDATYS